MADTPRDQNHDEGRDLVGELIRHAGRREPVDPDRTARVRREAFDAWQMGRRARRWRRRLRVAAALAGLVLAGAWWWPGQVRAPGPGPALAGILRQPSGSVTATSRSTRTGEPGPIEVESETVVRVGTQVATGADGRGWISLVTGGGIALGTDTEVAFPAAREVTLLRGTVYFDDEGAATGTPIVIHTPRGSVRDVGTRFEVHVAGDEVRVRVREGLVRLTGDTADHEVGAGTELTVSSGGPGGSRPFPRYGSAWTWVTRMRPRPGRNSRTLGALLSWVEREGGYRIVFDPPETRDTLRAIEVLGPIEELTVEEALDVMLPAAGLSHRIDDGRVTIQIEGRLGSEGAGR